MPCSQHEALLLSRNCTNGERDDDDEEEEEEEAARREQRVYTTDTHAPGRVASAGFIFWCWYERGKGGGVGCGARAWRSNIPYVVVLSLDG